LLTLSSLKTTKIFRNYVWTFKSLILIVTKHV